MFACKNHLRPPWAEVWDKKICKKKTNMLEFRKPGASSFPIVYQLTIDSHSSEGGGGGGGKGGKGKVF